MPIPKKGESEKDYVDRCIPIVMQEGTAKDGAQAAAICHSMYKEKHKGVEESVGYLFALEQKSGQETT